MFAGEVERHPCALPGGDAAQGGAFVGVYVAFVAAGELVDVLALVGSVVAVDGELEQSGGDGAEPVAAVEAVVGQVLLDQFRLTRQRRPV
jgi:hypothetical protein